MKRLISCALACALCLSLAACSKGDPAESASSKTSAARSYNVSAIFAQDDEYAAQVLAGANAAIEEAGADVTLDVSYAGNVKSQERILLDAVEPKAVNGVLSMPVSSDESIAMLNRVSERGVPVAIAGVATERTGFAAAAVAYDEYELGRAAGDAARSYIETKLSGKASIAVLHHNEADRVSSLQRQNGFFSALEDMDGVKAVGALDLSSADGAADRISEFLKAHEDVSVIFCTTGQALVFTQAAVTNAKLTAALFGVDAYRDVTDILRSADSSVVAVAAQDYYTMGRDAMNALLVAMERRERSMEPQILTPVLLTPEDTAALADFESKLG